MDLEMVTVTVVTAVMMALREHLRLWICFHLMTTFSPPRYFLLPTGGGAVGHRALGRNCTCSVLFSWPCFQLKLPARPMPAAWDKQPACSLRKRWWAGEICGRTHCVCPGVNTSKAEELGLFFFIYLSPLATIKVLFVASTALLICLKFITNLELMYPFVIFYRIATDE